MRQATRIETFVPYASLVNSAVNVKNVQTFTVNYHCGNHVTFVAGQPHKRLKVNCKNNKICVFPM